MSAPPPRSPRGAPRKTTADDPRPRTGAGAPRRNGPARGPTRGGTGTGGPRAGGGSAGGRPRTGGPRSGGGGGWGSSPERASNGPSSGPGGGPRAGRRGRPGHAVDEERAFRPEPPHPLGRRPTRAIPKPEPVAQEPSKKKRAPDPRKSRAPKSVEQKEAAKTSRVLNNGQLRYLRGLGHHLDPVVHVGKDGVTDALVAATKEALLAHELVKIKVLGECPVDRKEVGPDLAERAEATLAQILGRTILLYRRHPNKPKIDLPRR